MRLTRSVRALPRRLAVKSVAAIIALSGTLLLARALIIRQRAHRRPVGRCVRIADGCLECGQGQTSVFTMNTLAPNLVSRQRYAYVRGPFLNWDYRLDRLLDLLAKVRADIVCLQEIEIARAHEISNMMEKLGYGAVLQDRSGSKFTVGNATFYRTAKFELTFVDDRSRVLITAFQSRDCAPVSESRNGEETMAIGKASEEARSKKNVYVANCHLEGNPYKARERLSQLRNALHRVDTREASLGLAPANTQLVVAGDFNATAREGLYRFLLRGRLEGGYTEPGHDAPVVDATIAHPFLLHDVYATSAPFQMPFTYGRPGATCTIDFLWASDALRPDGVLQSLGPAEALRVQRTGLPDAVHPSDHLPLAAVFDITKVVHSQ